MADAGMVTTCSASLGDDHEQLLMLDGMGEVDSNISCSSGGEFA
jgi:hypothetical protein